MEEQAGADTQTLEELWERVVDAVQVKEAGLHQVSHRGRAEVQACFPEAGAFIAISRVIAISRN